MNTENQYRNPNINYEGESGILLKLPNRCASLARTVVGCTTEFIKTFPDICNSETREVSLPTTLFRKK